jgi:hypothetical protein
VYRQNQNASIWRCRQNLPRRVQPVQVRHSDIQQQHVWLQLAGTLDSFPAVSGLATNFPPGMAFEQGANAFPRHLVIVCDKDSKHAHLPEETRISDAISLQGIKGDVDLTSTKIANFAIP